MVLHCTESFIICLLHIHSLKHQIINSILLPVDVSKTYCHNMTERVFPSDGNLLEFHNQSSVQSKWTIMYYNRFVAINVLSHTNGRDLNSGLV